jgi:hypothetical protein
MTRLTVADVARPYRGLLAILAFLVWLAPSTAHAGDAAAAQDLFEQGLTLLENDDWDGACEKFRASMEAEPSGGTALNLGRCHERAGLTASAWAEYARAVSLFQAARDEERMAFAKERADRLEPSLSKLTIQVTPTPGLVVERDGVVVVEGAYGTPVAVDPGERTITARAEGYKTWTTTVNVGTSPDTYAVTVPALEEDPTAFVADQPTRGDQGGSDGLIIAGGVVTGVGGAAVLVGAILGGLVLSDASDYGSKCNDQVPDGADYTNGCPPDEVSAEDLDGTTTLANASTGLFVAGGVVAAGGIVMLIIGLMDDSSGQEMVRVLPEVGPSQAGLTLTGRF